MLRIAVFLAALLISIDTAVVLVISPFTLGSFFMICASAVFVLLALKWDYFVKLTAKWPGKIIKILFVAGISFFALFTAFDLFLGRTDAQPGRDLIIILGSGVKSDNTPTDATIDRLDAGMEYISENPKTSVIVCGGKTRKGCISEAEAMKNYLEDRGIPEEKIICEDNSLNTRQNFAAAYKIAGQLGLKTDNAVFVSTSFHILRAKYYAKLAGFENIKSIAVTVNPFLLLPSVAREMCAVAAALFLGY